MDNPPPPQRPPQHDAVPPPERPGPPHHADPRAAAAARWAPWWVYLVVLLGANYLRAGLLAVGTVPEAVVVVIGLAQAAVLFVVVTAVWRLTHRSGS